MDNDYKAYNEVDKERKEARSVMINVFVGCIVLFVFLLFFGRTIYKDFYVESGCVSSEEIYYNSGDKLTYLKSTNIPFNGFICRYNGDQRYVNGKKDGPHSGFWQDADYPNVFRKFISQNWLFSHNKKYTNYYSNGLLNGRCETFDINGNLISFENYLDGELNGEKGVISNGRWAYVSYKDGKIIKNNLSNDEIESQNESIAPLPKPKPITSETYAVIVGIDDYQYADDYSGDLRFAKDDAYAFEKFLLSEKGGQVPEYNISVITDNKASQKFIQSELSKMSQRAGVSDRLIFYFAGHGEGDYFLPSDFNQYDNNYLTIRRLDEIFKNSKAKHKILIADACIDKDLQRGRGTSSAAKNFNHELNKYKPSFVHLRSCQDDESSHESVEYQNGYFSHWLIEGLKGAADFNGNKIVTLQEVFEYVKIKVNTDVNLYVGKHQTPQLYGTADPNMPMSTLK